VSSQENANPKPIKPGIIAISFIGLALLAVVARTLATSDMRPILPLYLGLELVYVILYSLVLWKPGVPAWLMQLYLIFQSLLILSMLSLYPDFDFIVLLYTLLVYQVAIKFTGRLRWTWIGVMILLTAGGLVFYHGWLKGLALSFTTIAGQVVLAGYVIALQEIAASQRKSQELLGELQVKSSQLKEYAAQVEELASIRERNRLARQLHDTVSQLIFSISLSVRSAQLLLESEPGRVPPILTSLQEMTADALRQLRAFITQLHPPQQ
jgi:signal transduction histidine kinase